MPPSICMHEGKDIATVLPQFHTTHELLNDLLILNWLFSKPSGVQKENPAIPLYILQARGRLENSGDKSARVCERIFNYDQPALVEIFINHMKVGGVVTNQLNIALSEIFNRICTFESHLKNGLVLSDC